MYSLFSRFAACAAALLLSAAAASAQKSVYLLDDFAEGSVVLKDRSVVKTQLNIDTTQDKLLYMDAGTVMEMTDFSNVSAVYIGERTFIPYERYLYEIVPLDDRQNLLIRWHQKKIAIGKAGPYDQPVHGSVISVNPENYTQAGDFKHRSEDVYKATNTNTYAFLQDGRLRKFTDRKSFLKLFPEHKAAIEKFVSSNNLTFNAPYDVIRIARYAVSL